MRRKVLIAQLLLAEIEITNVSHHEDTEEGYIYKTSTKGGKKNTVRIKPGGTVAIWKKDEWETIDLGVPQDIVDLQEISMKDYHEALKSWLGDSRKFKEEIRHL